jgi:carbonic anhydrase
VVAVPETFRKTFGPEGEHACDTVLLSCADFRFIEQTDAFVRDHLGIRNYDAVSVPGACHFLNDDREVDTLIRWLSIPVRLHCIRRLVIINHEDCGAYGGSEKSGGERESEQRLHEDELRKARTRVLESLQVEEVTLAYARLTEDRSEVEFVIVE